jgi:phosphoglycolate phosphatase
MRRERGLSLLGAVIVSKWVSLGANALISHALEISPHDQAAVTNALSDFRSRYALMPTTASSVYSGVFELLEKLRSHQTLLSLCTNKPRPLTEKVLAETGLSAFFPFVCAGGDLPELKPHPTNVLACMNYHGTTSTDTWLVGDSTVDQNCALNAGIGFVFHASGYDDGVNRNICITSFEDYRSFNSDLLILITVIL